MFKVVKSIEVTRRSLAAIITAATSSQISMYDPYLCFYYLLVTGNALNQLYTSMQQLETKINEVWI